MTGQNHDNLVKHALAGLKKPARRPVLRMAPMIDIIFLLLIFFLVTAQWRPEEEFLPLQLPRATASQPQPAMAEPLHIYLFAAPAGLEVQLGQNPAIALSDQNLSQDLAQLVNQIQQTLENQSRLASDPIRIICDPHLQWRYLAKIYNLFYGMGLSDITFQLTEAPGDD